MEYKFGELVKELIEKSGIIDAEKEKIISSSRIMFDDLKRIHTMAPSKMQLLQYMSDMIPVFEVYERKADPEKKTKEYVTLMTRLRLEQEEKEYRQLLRKEVGSYVSEVDGIGKYAFMRHSEVDVNKLDIGLETKAVKYQMTTIFNIFLTVASVGYAVWYWSDSSAFIGNELRVLLSIFASILVLVAEVVVFGGYMRKVDDARDRERHVAERKEVVETVVIGGGDNNSRKRIHKRKVNGKGKVKGKRENENGSENRNDKGD